MKQVIALGGFVNLTLWLTWVRSSELFSLTFADIQAFAPYLWMMHDLPFNCGILCFLLLPEIKSSPSRKADILIAHQTKSGFKPLLWWNRVHQHSPDSLATKQNFLNDTGGP